MVITRRRGTLRRLAAALAVLVTALVVGLTTVPGIARAEGAIVPGYTKTLTPNSDGTYTVSLDVTGSVVTSEEDANPIDVVIVFDTSGSMGKGPGSLMQTSKDAADTLAQQLLSNNEQGSDRIQIALVDFNTHASVHNFARWGQQYWTSDYRTISGAIDDLSSGGGTNWEAGLAEANGLSTGRANAEKYIIFLSDGNPTFRDSSMVTTPGHYETQEITEQQWVEGHWWGPIWIPGHFEDVVVGTEEVWVDDRYDEDGYSNYYGAYGTGDADEYGANYQAAVNEANARGDAKLYVVELADEATKMETFANDTGGEYLDGSSTDGLRDAFDQIAQDITRSYSFGQVKITDALSQWAEFAVPGGDAAETPTFTYQKGVDGNLSEWAEAPAATVGSDGLITWDLSSVGTLEANTTYRLSFVIRPNQLAYDQAVTGMPEGEVDSETGEGGFFSNDNEKANLTYSVVTRVNDGAPEYGQPQTVPYQKPVMNVPISTVTIQKSWPSGATGLPQSVEVALYRDDDQEAFATVELTADNNWTAEVTVSAGPTGHTYTISEVNPGEGWVNDGYQVNGKDGREVKLTGLTAQSAAFTVTNVPESFSLWVTKTDSADPSMVLNGATFDLYKADDNGAFVQDDDHKVSEGTVGGEGKRAQFDGLTLGTYYLLETSVPAGYQLRTEPYKIVVSTDGIQFAKTADGVLSDASAVDGQDRTYQVSFENTKVAGGEIPDTGGIGDVPLYAAGVMAVAGSVLAARRVRSH